MKNDKTLLKRTKRVLRRSANRMLEGRGLEIVNTQIERSPLKQLLLAMAHFQIDVVLDIGANTGQFAQDLLESGFKGTIHSVEPLPDAHKVLQAASTAHPNWRVLERMAAGADEREIEIQVAGNSYSSSVLDMLERHIAAAPDSAPVGRVKVQQRRLDALFADQLQASRPTLLKIDTQGYEYPILQGATACLEKVTLVLLELSLQPLYRGQMLWLDLLAEMRQRGFEVWSIQPEFCDPHSGQLLQVNGLFYRAADTA